jgi:dipeptidyl aminopeptidase/acylaminoacyl peptidase
MSKSACGEILMIRVTRISNRLLDLFGVYTVKVLFGLRRLVVRLISNVVTSVIIILGVLTACSYFEVQPTAADLPDTLVPEDIETLPSTMEPGTEADVTSVPTVPILETSPPPGGIPDTLQIAYVKAGDIWLWKPLGPVQITSLGDVHDLRLSPDGQLIAFTRRVDGYHAELWVQDLREGQPRQLVGVDAFDAIAENVREPTTVAVNPYQFEWVPGGHQLAFNSIQSFDGPGFALINDLQIADADNSERWTLLQPGTGGEFAYSPDGNQVAIVTPTEIYLMNSNAANWRLVLPYEQVSTYSEYRYHAQPVWSPDSSHLRVALPPTDPLDPSLSTELWYLPTDGSAAYLEGQVWPLPFMDTPVMYAPDLEHIIYLAETGQPAENRRDLRIAAADGSAEQIYTNDQLLRFLGWGLDSQHFTYVAGDDAFGKLGLIDAQPTVMINDASAIHGVHWVDERFFVIVRQSPDGFELWLTSVEGGVVPIDLVQGAPPRLDSVR